MKTLITGSNSGMGYETAVSLAKQNHTIILTSRQLASAQAARGTLLQAVPDAEIIPLQLDLNSFKSIEKFANNVHQQIDVLDNLIFNAGIMNPPYARTEDGFESQFQANYLGHFYLFHLLLDLMRPSEVKKVISISSLSSEKGTCDTIDEFASMAQVDEADYEAMTSYRESKLAQVLFTVELAQRFGAEGFKSYAIHPGVVNTNLFYRDHSAFYKTVMKPFVGVGYLVGFLKTPEQGAETAVYLATHDVDENGQYWADNKIRPMNPIADNKQVAHDFWEWSNMLVF